jgi:hypothetical protein
MAAAADAAPGGGGIGGFEPSATVMAKQLGEGGGFDLGKSMQPPAQQMPYGEPIQPEPTTGFSAETSAPAPTPQQKPVEQPKEVPYDQYASLASTAAQIAQMFQPQVPQGGAPIPQATIGPYSPTAQMFVKQRNRGGY